LLEKTKKLKKEQVHIKIEQSPGDILIK